MSQLKALKGLYVGKNKLPSADVDFIIDSFPQLTTLAIDDLGLTGEQLHVVPELVLLTCMRSAAIHHWEYAGAHESLRARQPISR